MTKTYSPAVLNIAQLLRQNSSRHCDAIAGVVEKLGPEYAFTLARQAAQHSQRPKDRYNRFIRKAAEASQPPHHDPKLQAAVAPDVELDKLMRKTPRR